jgi:chromosome condensin MukBEF ATPase and DNA-binding subunit MukB
MTNPARYLPPADPRVTDDQTFSTYARVVIETLPGVSVTAGGRLIKGGPYTIEVPVEDVPKLRAKVRDHEAWAVCERSAERMLAEAKKNQTSTLNISAAAEYQRRHGKGGGSLARFEVVEENVPAPLSKDQRQMAQVMAHVQAAMRSTPGYDSDSGDDVTPAPRRRGRPPKSQD